QIPQTLLDLGSNPASPLRALNRELPSLNYFPIGLSRDQLEFGPTDFNADNAHFDCGSPSPRGRGRGEGERTVEFSRLLVLRRSAHAGDLLVTQNTPAHFPASI